MGDEKRFFLFLILTTLLVMLTPRLFQIIRGRPAQRPAPAAAPPLAPPAQQDAAGDPAAAPRPHADDQAVAAKAAGEAVPPQEPEPAPQARTEPELESRALGSTDPASQFKLKVALSNRGAAVQTIELSEFKAEDPPGKRLRMQDRPPLKLVSGELAEELSFPFVIDGISPSLAERHWEILDDGPPDEETVQVRFRTRVPQRKLTITKTYSLKKQSYQIGLTIAIEASERQTLLYRLGGPRGFLLEGAWYASKLRDAVIGGGVGNELSRQTIHAAALAEGAQERLEELNLLADVTGQVPRERWTLDARWFDRLDHDQNGKLSQSEKELAAKLLAGGEKHRWVSSPLRLAGVEGQYFSAMLILPPPEPPSERRDAATLPVLVRAHPKKPQHSDVSVELESKVFDLERGQPLEHAYAIYAGPRKREVLDQTLSEPALTQAILYDHGWFFIFPRGMVSLTADLMLALLHLFHGWVGNWGVAIIMLTVLVRLLMFPLSRKQALAAVKMQALKPELDALREKHKNDKEKLSRAQMELWRKHNVNPLGGCLPVVVQMPIFIGLWQGLSSSVDLRQARFIGWIDNLAAPDALFPFPWGETVPILSFLGPYFNLLPTLLIVLMIIQQKMFMPPKTNPPDPQMEMQQKMMMFMMIFFGFLFYRLPSGLCVYYVASTLWGMAERKFLPKLQHVVPATVSGAEKEERASEARKASRSSGPDGRGPGRDGKGRAATTANGLTWKEWISEVLKKAKKR